MCGIVGCAGDISAKEEGAFKQLLIVNSLRGIDSTGVAVVGRHTGDVKIRKQVGDVFQLMDNSRFAGTFSGVNRLCLGHNRWGTVGAATRKNAHPFEFDKVVGVHNGTLKNKWNLPNHTNFETDSEALYAHINNVGIEEAIKGVDGAYALVWYDKEEGTLNMLRNKERPLTFAYSKDKKQLFFASEAWMMQGVCGREGIALGDAVMIAEDTLYKFDISVATGQQLGEAEVSQCKPLPFQQPKITPAIYQHGKGHSWGGGTGSSKKEEKQQSKLAKKSSASSVVGLPNFGMLRGLVAQNHGRNTNGACFVSFTHPDKPGIEYRLHKASVVECMEILHVENAVWKAEVAMLTYENGNAIGRLKVNTFQKDERTILMPLPNTIEDDEEVAPKQKEVLADHHGKPITTQEFEKRYGTCSACGGNIDTTDTYFPFSHNEVLCEDCAKNPQLHDFLKGATSCGC